MLIIEVLLGVVGPIIGAVIGALATHVLENRKKKDVLSFAELSNNLSRLVGEARTIQMYTVNSYVLCNQISMLLGQNQSITLDKVIKCYQKHFDNIVERYRDRLMLYTTENV